jgi:hypothetical protein
MKLLNFFLTKRKGTLIVMVLIVIIQILGLPTNIGGPWHLTKVWDFSSHWLVNAIIGAFMNIILLALYFHVKDEFKKTNK